MYIKHNILFLIDKEPGKTDGKLRLRVRWSGNVVSFSVGFRVDCDKWIPGVQRVRNNTFHGDKKIPAQKINKEITRLTTLVEDLFSHYDNEGINPTPSAFRASFNRANGRKTRAGQTLFDCFDMFVSQQSQANQWTEGTLKKMNTLKMHLLSYDKDLAFDCLTEDRLHDYIRYLRDETKLRNSSIQKDIALLKWFLRWATRKGYNHTTAFVDFSPKFKTTEKRVIFLDWEELMRVYRFTFPQNKIYLDRARDVFCFCCFTSLRYSDVANLKRSDVHKDHISVITVKTADKLKIELNDYSREILGKYADFRHPYNLVLPVCSNQKMNAYLKEIGRLCGIDTPVTLTYYRGNERIEEVHPKYELLTTHAGRRTFICNALTLGIPAQVVMKWTGHSDYKAMKPYIDITDAAKKESMNKFNRD